MAKFGEIDNIPQGFYVYILLDGEIPFYIGYGSNDRVFDHEKYARETKSLGFGLTEDYNPYKTRKIKKLLASGREVNYVILPCQSKDIAITVEKSLITIFGRKGLDRGGVLTNRAPGGHGGYTWEHRKDDIDWNNWSKKTVEEKQEILEKIKSTKIQNGTWKKRWNDNDKRREVLRNRAVSQRKPVVQLDRDNNQVIARWDSALAASKATGIHQGSLSQAARLYPKGSAGGFKWRYESRDVYK